MKIETINDKRYMKYDHYVKQPTEMIELKLIMITSENQHMIYSPDRSINLPLIR